jgi:cell division septum initiation protein DivIVA
MEPEPQQLDREAIRADHKAVSERIDREVETMLAAAAAKRRAYLDETVDHLRAEVEQKQPTTADEDATPPEHATGVAKEDAIQVPRRLAAVELELARTSAKRDELQALLAIAESERETAHAELRAQSDHAADLDRQLQELRAQEPSSESSPDEDAAARLLVAAARAADDVRDASRSRALQTLLKARDLAARVHTETEREREALAEAQQRRAELEGEKQAILTQAVVAADSRAAEIVAERHAEAESEAAAIVAKARAEADSLVGLIEDQRHRVRELLAGTLASLDVEDGGPQENLMADLESRLHETTEPTA